ncbi:MAG: hypothetical protein M0Z66_01965 [Thermaerobacter sp.]|nr:hypothetical protein [Thermaerobacter sp.]
MNSGRCRVVGSALLAGLLLAGCGTPKAAVHRNPRPLPPLSGQAVQIAGYTAHVPSGPLGNTMAVDAALTPYGLVWSSYRSAVLRGGVYVMPHPYRVHLSPGGGHGALERSGHVIAQIPQTDGGQSVDLYFAGATGPYLAFSLTPTSSHETLAVGIIDLPSGRVSMLAPQDARGADVVVAGGRVALVTTTKAVLYDLATGAYTTLPLPDTQTLGYDLGYGLLPGSHAAPGHALPGVAAYAISFGGVIYGPPGWKLSETDTGGDWVRWQLTDPVDAHSYVQKTESACNGCASIGWVPGALLSPGPTKPPKSRWLSDFAIETESSQPGSPYPVLSMSIAPVPGRGGSLLVEVSLPKAQSALAQRILGSFGVPH